MDTPAIEVFQSPTAVELREILKDEKLKTKINQMVNEYIVHYMDPADDVFNSVLSYDGLEEQLQHYKQQALDLGADEHDDLLNKGMEKMRYLWMQGKPFSAMKFVTFYGWHCARLAKTPQSRPGKRPAAPTPPRAKKGRTGESRQGKRFFQTKWTKKVTGPVSVTKMPVAVARYPFVHQHSFVPIASSSQEIEEEEQPYVDVESDTEGLEDVD